MPSVFIVSQTFARHKSAWDVLQKVFTKIVITKNREHALEELVPIGDQFDAVIIGVKEKIDSRILNALPKVRVLGSVTVGVDHIDMAELTSRGVALVTAKGANANSVAEHTLMMILSLLKHSFGAHQAVIAGLDRKGLPNLPRELRKKTVGILGAGDTAKALLTLLHPFNCPILSWTPHPERHEELARRGVAFSSVDSIFQNADVVSLHLPLTPETKGIVTGDRIKSMLEDAVLINVARKELFALQELKEALMERPDIRIGLDDFEINKEEFFETIRNRCVLSPHIAGVTEESLGEMMLVVAKGVSAVIAKDNNHRP